MHDWLYDFVVSGADFVFSLQQHHTGFLDIFFLAATTLGNEEAYLLGIPLCYWVVNKRVGRELAYLIIVAGVLNSFLKDGLDLPRPFQFDSRIIPLIRPDGAGLPSGHAMLSATLWGYFAWVSRKQWPWTLAVTVATVACVAFSRLYLGVHFPADVITGLVLGATVLFLWVRFAGAAAERLSRYDTTVRLGLAVILPACLLFLHPPGAGGYPAAGAAGFAGLLLGVNIGVACESRRVRFALAGTWQKRSLRYLVGLLCVVACWAGLRIGFAYVPGGHVVEVLLRFVRYAVTGLALTWWAPAAFVRLGLAGREG